MCPFRATFETSAIMPLYGRFRGQSRQGDATHFFDSRGTGIFFEGWPSAERSGGRVLLNVTRVTKSPANECFDAIGLNRAYRNRFLRTRPAPTLGPPTSRGISGLKFRTSIQLEHFLQQRLNSLFRSMSGARRIRHVRISFHTTVAVGEGFFGFGIRHRPQRLLYYDTKNSLRIFHHGWVGGQIWIIIRM
jgi:hypothetical protein